MFAHLATHSEQNRLFNLLASYGTKQPIINVFEAVPRELFVDAPFVDSAYEDRALPIGSGQTISQPSLVATMLEALELTGSEKVLEIGTGSGFEAALLGKLARRVYTIERIRTLAASARGRLKKLRLSNVSVIVSDGTLGLAKCAPYDAIIVTAAFKSVPQPLIDQLRNGGRLIMPVGERAEQEVVLYKKTVGRLVPVRKIAPVRFVPLIGKYAWNYGAN